MTRFRNRGDAGRQLAAHLDKYANRADVRVMALPRGGVPVGYEVAQILNAPLDVFVVRKLGVPGQEELAMGALASGGGRVIHEAVVEAFGISDDVIEAVTRRAQRELERRERVYGGAHPTPPVQGQTVLLVDDGIATGSTMKAAVQALRHRDVGRLVVAVPTASLSAARELRPMVDEIVAVMLPADFLGVGQWYEEFSQTTDDEVRDLLEKARERLEANQP